MEGGNNGGIDTTDEPASLRGQIKTNQMGVSGNRKGMNDAVRKKYGHLSRTEIFGLINKTITPQEAEILLLDLEIDTRKDLHSTNQDLYGLLAVRG